MVRLTRIYTRTGDGGTTRLVGGQEVPKDDGRIEAYGTVDELNAVLGMVRTALSGVERFSETDREWLDGWLHNVQQRLFDVGSDLATLEADRYEGQPTVTQDQIDALEADIDRMNSELEPLSSFVLPGGGPLTSPLHLARTVCRRAERRTISLARDEGVSVQIIPYLNRLSDALFVLSRWAALRADEPEVLWEI
ncbi:MAG: cob(I)yrinic acid a,c-diamide adenosyltransferase [Myxococcota bacterium]|nr:cob(I)yrinic acid a,c-diamide adenosyltransferase [Myxococcota bacterium]